MRVEMIRRDLIKRRLYAAAIRRLHGLGVMINGSFVFGMDGDDDSVFGRTVEWAIEQGIETATFHVLTPYPHPVSHVESIFDAPVHGDGKRLAVGGRTRARPTSRAPRSGASRASAVRSG